MNLHQLEYILAVQQHRHFARAAEACFVTQPTLSMMIHKLEEELGVKIFDRSKQPVEATREGEAIICHARAVLAKVGHLKDYVRELQDEISGDLHIGVIPTLAPYLLPLFLQTFHDKYPKLHIYVKEMVTDDIIAKLGTGGIDLGLLALPVHEPHLEEHPLFYEEFFVYASKGEKLPRKKYLLPKQIDVSHLWLLEEGHCLRNQVFNLCELKKRDHRTLNYEAGSIETLINLVDHNTGITIIPQLAALKLTTSQKKNLREFSKPRPAREIGLLAVKDFPRKRLLDSLKAAITEAVPPYMIQAKQKQVTSIDLPA